MIKLLTPEASQALAIDTIDEQGVQLFPVKPGAKFPPQIPNNLVDASDNPEQIKTWVKQFSRNGVGPNWGIALRKSRKLIVDVDVKPGKGGSETYLDLDLEYGWPETYTVGTPSGGWHAHYDHVGDDDVPFALGKYGFGDGIDVPNYALIAGCTCQEKDGSISAYTVTKDVPRVPAPPWFYDVIKNSKKVKLDRADESAVRELDTPIYIAWAIDFLKNDAAPAIEGQGGEQTTYKVACSLRENGISRSKAIDLMMAYYNVEFICEPLWDLDGLTQKIDNAYDYANLAMAGGKTAEADFGDIDETETLASIKTSPPAKIAADKAVREEITLNKKDALTGAQISKAWVFVGNFNRWVNREDTIMLWKNEQIDNMYRTPKEKRSSLAAILLSSGIVRKYVTAEYLPGKPTDCWPVFNLYNDPGVVPAEGDLEWWDDHLIYLFPDKADRDHVLNWMAWLVQNLTLKPKHALLVQGQIQGTGKSFLSDMLTRVVGIKNTKALAEDDLHNAFNPWAVRSKLLVVEELRAVERAGVKGKLHNIITQETISVNEKGISQRDVTNCFGIFAMSNDDAAISLDDTDRRYLVVRTDAIPRDKPSFGVGYDPRYYDRLYARLFDPACVAAVAYRLQNRDLAGYDARRKAPITAAKEEMIKAGASDLERAIIDLKVDYPLNGSIVTLQDVVDALPKRLERTPRLNSQIVSFIKKHCGAIEAGQFRISNGTRPRLYVINGSGVMNFEDWRKNIANSYERGRKMASSAPKAGESAADDFSVGGED